MMERESRTTPLEDYFGLTDEEFRVVVQVIRQADEEFEKHGGGTRHWLRDHFLPGLDTAGFQITRKPSGTTLPLPTSAQTT